jgi:hypothetical protein
MIPIVVAGAILALMSVKPRPVWAPCRIGHYPDSDTPDASTA